MIDEKQLVDAAVDYALENGTDVLSALGAMRLAKRVIGKKAFHAMFAQPKPEDLKRYDEVASKLVPILDEEVRCISCRKGAK